MRHLTARVAWHDSRWSGRVCDRPAENSFCTDLDRVRAGRDDEHEAAHCGVSWAELGPAKLPPCAQEGSGFMSPSAWRRTFVHPYAHLPKAKETHGSLLPTTVEIPPYSGSAVPFAWMLRREQKALDSRTPKTLPPDEPPPFKSPWVFGRQRQAALLELFFGSLVPEKSLAFFYCKSGHPLGEGIPRVVVAVGRILSVAKPSEFRTSNGGPTYLFWDRRFRHSVREDGEDGFLLPYHDYLEPTGDPEEDERRAELLTDIIVQPDSSHLRTFSYAAELAGPDVALSTLVRCLEAVRSVRDHGIAAGPWAARESWLNDQISTAWSDRGPFPGVGPVLEALGLRMGTALCLELLASGEVARGGDPWPAVSAILEGRLDPPQQAYEADVSAAAPTWGGLSEERRRLAVLLSRFALTSKQAARWFNPRARAGATGGVSVTDGEILLNPYRMAELDLGEQDDSPVDVGMVDRGLLPDPTVSAAHPVQPPAAVESNQDKRRVRAVLVALLRAAADDGDALLSRQETLERLAVLRLSPELSLTSDWLAGNAGFLDGVISQLTLEVDPKSDVEIPALQLSEVGTRERQLAKLLVRRAGRSLAPLHDDWSELIKASIGEAFDPGNARHNEALDDQARALSRVTSRKLAVLVGRAGTGKTSVLGGLLRSEVLRRGGILLLAPTGKARVRLGRAAGAAAMTIAQFLNSLGRYDGKRQRPRFSGERHRQERTVVIDECSMLTMDDLLAVLLGLDLAHVKRLILVGDPNQLPPIGTGRPFADLVAHLEGLLEEEGDAGAAGALARLEVEVRAVQGGPSDTLRLASLFTRDVQRVDSDRVFSDLELGAEFNDLAVIPWSTPEALLAGIGEAFVEHLGLEHPRDRVGFNRALGLTDEGFIDFDSPDGAEAFQLLSPVRLQPHGTAALNRWIQRTFREPQRSRARAKRALSLGDEELVLQDKVIQLTNQRREAYDGSESSEHYLANGEVGVVATGNWTWLNVVFAGRPGLRFGYRKWDFPQGAGPLSLAYALTVHKSQGSEFERVFLVIPARCRLLSRELLYTAVTRSKQQLILLVEGDDPSVLFQYTQPERSETNRRNTNLFRPVVRERRSEVPWAEHLIHKTKKGHMVRSKSELVIANELFGIGLDYEYERPLEGEERPGKLRPDFSFVDPAGELIVWEHLGMLHREDYRLGWEWKRQWYLDNGFIEGETLFTTRDDENGGLDMGPVSEVAGTIQELME